jgi:hypothetical protein
VLQDTLLARQDVVIPIANNVEAARRQIAVTLCVDLTFVVLSAVCLDNQPPFEARKIYDPRSNRHLSAKFCINEAAATQEPPKGPLRVGGPSPQGLGKSPLSF